MVRLVALVLTAIVTAPAAAQPEPLWPGSPTDAVREYLDGMITLAADPTLGAEARHGAASIAVAETFDFAELSKRALGGHWARMTGSERADVIEGIRAILTAVYTSRMGHYLGVGIVDLRERIHFIGESISGRAATVTLTVAYAGKDLPLQLALLRRGRGWRIWDLSVDGMRLTDNIRAQVAHLSRRGDYTELLARLRARRETLIAARPPSARSGSPSQ